MSDSDTGMAAQFALKAALRRSMNKTLRAMPEVELRDQLAKHLLQQPFFQRARTVGCYLSMARGELRTDDIVAECLKQEKKLYIPYLPPKPRAASASASSATGPHAPSAPSAPHPDPVADETPEMHMLRLYSLDDMRACPLDKWGILDPGEGRKDVDGAREDILHPDAPDLDLILVPGVAFDEDCNRLGRGKAYYDRFLAKYTAQRKSPLLVALALSPQILPKGDTVPTTPTDFQLDGVLTPAGLVWRAGAEPPQE